MTKRLAADASQAAAANFYPALAPRAGAEKHDDHLGLLFPDGHRYDAAGPVCDARRAGATSLLHTVMSH